MVVPTVIHELVRKPWLVWIASAGGVGSREGGCWWVQAGANVDAPAPAYLLIFLVLPVSCDPHRPTRSKRHSPHLARRADKRESCGGGAITDFVAAAAPVGGAAVDRIYGITRPYASSPPARRVVPGAAQPPRRR